MRLCPEYTPGIVSGPPKVPPNWFCLSGGGSEVAKKLRGQVAIASATIAYQSYNGIFESERFRKLVDHGARVQRLLWASTSTKNPEYSNLKYVESLIGPDTVNTLTLETLEAYRTHGDPKSRLDQDVEQASWVLQRLRKIGINIDQVTQQLEDEGVQKFVQAFDLLMNALKKKQPATARVSTGGRI